MPCSSSAAVILPVCGGIEAARDQRVRRRRRDLEHDERDREDGHGRDAEQRLGLGREGEDVLEEGRHGGLGQTWVWKMVWTASTAFVRIWLASCIESCARSTAITTAVGSVAWPVARSWAAWRPRSASGQEAAQHLPEAGAAGVAGLGWRLDGRDLPLGTRNSERRIDGHRRISRVLANICLEADIAVTLAS